MRAITVVPGRRDSVALTDMPEPPEAAGPVLVETRAVGVCGTDLEIINGEYGQAPAGADRLVIGHESLGQVIEAPAGTGLHRGDLVVGIVRRRDLAGRPADPPGGDWPVARGLHPRPGGHQDHPAFRVSGLKAARSGSASPGFLFFSGAEVPARLNSPG